MRSSLKKSPLELQQSLQYYEDRWSQASSHSARSLLRLAVLRELRHWLHSQISHAMVVGPKELIQTLRRLEEMTSILGTRSLAEEKLPFAGLFETLKHVEALSPAERSIPESIFKIIPRRQIERIDSFWESALIAEGSVLQWKIWNFTASVPLKEVEPWSKKLFLKLWPNGLFLWVEAAEAQSNLWKGTWFALLDPNFNPNRIDICGPLEWKSS